MLAVSVVLCLASQFRWLDVVWTNTAGCLDFVTDQSGTAVMFTPPQHGIVSCNQFGSGNYNDVYVPSIERRFHFLDSLSLPVVSAPGIKGWANLPPATKIRFYALYLNHLYFLLLAEGSYAFARFYVRRRLKTN